MVHGWMERKRQLQACSETDHPRALSDDCIYATLLTISQSGTGLGVVFANGTESERYKHAWRQLWTGAMNGNHH